MRYQPKSKKANILILMIPIVAVIVTAVFGVTSTRSAMRVGYAGNEGRSSWSGRYMLLDGTMQKSVHPSGDTLHVAVETKSGTISIEIRDADGNVIFDGESIGTASFDVNVSGKAVVRIAADNHMGCFDIQG